MELNKHINTDWDFTCGPHGTCNGIPGNDPSWPPYIVQVTDKLKNNKDRWYFNQHKELLQSGVLYATHGSLWLGELQFRIEDKVYRGNQLNILQLFGGTGYGIVVIDKNNPIKQ